MEKQYRYMVKRDGNLPTLLRVDPDSEEKVYCSGSFEKSEAFYWVYAPELEDILIHKDRFPEYIDIGQSGK